MDSPLKPLKRFGQNFLTDNNIIKKITGSLDLSKEDVILEIGPGRGALTFVMTKRVKRLVAVEVDRGLCSLLKEQTKDFKNTDVICADILKFNLGAYAKKNKIKSFKVVANLPYYITTPILEFLFKNIKFIDAIFLTMQKEVADRIVAPAGNSAYGSLSCFVAYYCTPRILFKIKAGSFWPVPKIESAFVRLQPIENKKAVFKIRSEELLFSVIRSAFSQRRKRLYSSLNRILNREGLNQLPAQDLLSKRSEELSLSDFIVLSNLIFDFSRKR